MRRRGFIIGAGCAAAWPLAGRAQQGPMPTIGFLHPSSPELFTSRLLAFRRGLSERGFAEGQNVRVEYRWGQDRLERLPDLAADLAQRNVQAIVAGGNVAALTARAATSTIPIIFLASEDPVKLGLVPSLNRPGGNLTGVAALDIEVAPKRIEALHEVVDPRTSIALMVNSDDQPRADSQEAAMRIAASALGRDLRVARVGDEGAMERAFAMLAQARVGGVVVGPDVFFNSRIDKLADLSMRHRLPTVYQFREFVAAGGLMSYGGSLTDTYRQVGAYTGRVLKGDRPADLPVEQTVKIELFINLRTVKALGLTLPLSLIGRADEVIE